MKFELSENDQKNISEWLEKIYAKRIEKQKESDDPLIRYMAEEGIPYYGAVGGELTYCFTPNSIGMSYKVVHCDGEELDLTDVSSW